ncbi:MAG: hypothetical protein IM488_18275 [Microcystis sp. M025S2]|uniref:hypothetical protein n=1 Tax=Microcystis sp. M025S2 TaxID=2771161 RepID=UPI00258EEEAF|nr:hypothetical protein [Microcystis sp. M025S2]MCA2711275.1 hypothetical protein [Microcystis sp. M025S2]
MDQVQLPTLQLPKTGRWILSAILRYADEQGFSNNFTKYSLKEFRREDKTYITKTDDTEKVEGPLTLVDKATKEIYFKYQSLLKKEDGDEPMMNQEGADYMRTFSTYYKERGTIQWAQQALRNGLINGENKDIVQQSVEYFTLLKLRQLNILQFSDDRNRSLNTFLNNILAILTQKKALKFLTLEEKNIPKIERYNNLVKVYNDITSENIATEEIPKFLKKDDLMIDDPKPKVQESELMQPETTSNFSKIERFKSMINSDQKILDVDRVAVISENTGKSESEIETLISSLTLPFKNLNIELSNYRKLGNSEDSMLRKVRILNEVVNHSGYFRFLVNNDYKEFLIDMIDESDALIKFIDTYQLENVVNEAEFKSGQVSLIENNQVKKLDKSEDSKNRLNPELKELLYLSSALLDVARISDGILTFVEYGKEQLNNIVKTRKEIMNTPLLYELNSIITKFNKSESNDIEKTIVLSLLGNRTLIYSVYTLYLRKDPPSDVKEKTLYVSSMNSNLNFLSELGKEILDISESEYFKDLLMKSDLNQKIRETLKGNKVLNEKIVEGSSSKKRKKDGDFTKAKKANLSESSKMSDDYLSKTWDVEMR